MFLDVYSFLLKLMYLFFGTIIYTIEKKIILKYQILFIPVIVLFGASKKKDFAHDIPITPVVYENHSSSLINMMHTISDSMTAMTMTGYSDNNFANKMMMHHCEALNMAAYELSNGNDSVILMLAQVMKDMQQMEIQKLDSFVMAHTLVMIDTPFQMKSEEAMHLMDKNVDSQKLNGDSDHDFAHLIIPHYQSAMEMAHAEMEYGQIQMLKDMAEEMIKHQQMEINGLQSWLISNN